MAGHSQFKNIMHRKGRQDKVKSKLCGKLAREITVSAKLGTPDPAMNLRLRAAVRRHGAFHASLARAIARCADARLWHSRDPPPRTTNVRRYPDCRPTITSQPAASNQRLRHSELRSEDAN